MIIVGAKGHTADLLTDSSIGIDINKVLFFDNISDDVNEITALGGRVLRSFNELKLYSGDKKFCLAIGNPITRKYFWEIFMSNGFRCENLISSLALISKNTSLSGCNIMPFSSIFKDSNIGKGVLLNSYASIHHNCTIGDFTVISPGARVLGHTIIGNLVNIGANATILPYTQVGDNSIIGAGAVVTKDVLPNSLIVGVPGKVVKILKE